MRRFFYDILASFTLLTRLPLWRLYNIPEDSFRRTVNGWTLVGWLTGALTGGILWLCAQVLPIQAAVIMAFAARVLLTGGLHEDGLGDVFDGFGGGRNKEKVLEIMKDSRTGSYGVIGLVLYFILLFALVAFLPVPAESLALLAGTADPLCKLTASQIVNVLPYARKFSESKTGTVYSRMSLPVWLFSAAAGVLPAILWMPAVLWPASIMPILTSVGLFLYFKRKIGGYTGDCCGAVFLLSELSFYFGVWIVLALR